MLITKQKIEVGKKITMQLPISIKSIDKEAGTLEAIFSTADVDRHGDKVMQDGWDLSMFKKNPVILNSHNYNDATEVIGSAENIRVESNKLQSSVRFAVNENPKAKIIFDLYANDFLHAFSVGFIVQEFKQNKDGTTDYYTIVKAELLEVSAVSVPANARALAKAKGIDTDQLPAEEENKENNTNQDDQPQPPQPESAAEPDKGADEIPKDNPDKEAAEQAAAGNGDGGDGGQAAEEQETQPAAGGAGTEPDAPVEPDNSIEKSYRAKVLSAIKTIESKEKAQIRAVAEIVNGMLNDTAHIPKKTAEQIRKRKVNQAIRALMQMR